MHYRLTPEAHRSISRSIFLTGSMRTGTTMMMRILGTLDGLEMFNEPPLLYSLFPLIETLDPEHWKYLFETALFEDRLVLSLRGKSLSLNQNDDACILKMKSKEDVDGRLANSDRRAIVLNTASSRHIAFKVPEMTHLLTMLRTLYPSMINVVMIRQPIAVVSSMMVRGYFSDADLNGLPIKWPLHARVDCNLPFWLPETEHEEWVQMNQATRCCRAYVWQYENFMAANGDYVVDYESFLGNPQGYLERLVSDLGFSFGSKTSEALREVRSNKSVIDTSIVQFTSRDILDRAERQYARIASSDFMRN